MSARPKDIVAKVENRTTSKVSQKLIFGRRGHCNIRNADTKLPGRFGANDVVPHLASSETHQWS
jgi:hypothetical protein